MDKEIGMQKLIRYLLESKGEEHKEEYYEWYRDVELEQNIDSLSELKPFIKWLVENDKIDLLQLDNRIALSMSIEFNKVERVLMALSISDEPIRFLCEILK